MMTREVHPVALTYNQISQDMWITEQEWERKETTLRFYFFQQRQKLKSSSFPSKQKPAISGTTSPGFLQHCPHPCTLSLYGTDTGVPRAGIPPLRGYGAELFPMSKLRRQPLLVLVRSWVGCSWTQHLQFQNSIALPDEIRRFIGSVFSFLGILFCSSDYGDECNKSKSKCI